MSCLRPVVWSLCDHSGVMVRPWAEAGYKCICFDLKHDRGGRVELFGRAGGRIDYVRADLSGNPLAGGTGTWESVYGAPRFVFAFPPCTHLAASGARWFAGKGLDPLIDSLALVRNCQRLCELARVGWMIENPVGRLSTCWRKPDHTFNPCDFGGYLDPAGDAYTKRTCLWVGGRFRMPEPRPVEPTEGSKLHRLPPSGDRAELRSVTPAGFARAVFLANHNPEG
jgi:hypothetical protein